MLERECAVELLEFSPAISEWREPFSKNPGREPALCGPEALEPLNRFEPSIELLVHAFNKIGRSRAIDMKERFRSYVGGQLLAALKDMVHGGDLHRIILMAR